MSQATQNFVDKCKQLFEEADVDHNGLSIQELYSIVHKVSGNKLSDAEIADMFVDMDHDGDKKISFDEFADVFRKKDPKKIQEVELKEAFKKFDRDGSGTVNKAEMKSQILSLGIKISDDHLEKLFKKADKNGDGNINYAEFLTAWNNM